MNKVRKAVIPAAGFGTRFLPQTKAMPKEMLPIVDKPVIQYVVEELVEAGIQDIFIVTGYHKRGIEDHFDSPNLDLIENLKMGGEKKRYLLEEVEKISNMANFVYVRQKGPYGNGTPLFNVKHLIGDEPFIYTWSDDFIKAEPNRFKQLIVAYEKYGASCMASLRATKDEDYNRYGCSGGVMLEDGIMDVKEIIEKPGKDKAPSDMMNISGYLFTSDIFDYLDTALANLKVGAELYYNDALKLMLDDKKRVLAVEIKNGKYYDTGNKMEYLKTVVEFALARPDINGEFREYLKSLNI
ncbi:MAG: Nucleotidyl transferase [Microgenomates group bacterium GW2011_GWC1_39_7b]|uniref:UTP--glucose-1-phosphate uridylyltransferase n=3 Tax=Candidatus Woeseibacteriota TaxID=1752722 RepID=A0A0G0LJ06_9BACT|nr:MAG: Nucleotidyl transferase [Candidatus Woesebacteria bacterium GW2011_GWB1_39_10]KKR27024.1 MAG: Nucleotidyl transferase [Microgenomates group bacterium GW2011_GWC1_39_7b]KKR73871.1 MAG: Nucleotidyl transferase [Candidatus Woesebacteria bacterium GW2011_GWA2_40_7]KKS90873.1 MAG: Nucleotidyl transferase [Candidatus Woesebacteria bacterium GW2011_GWA1_43_12]